MIDKASEDLVLVSSSGGLRIMLAEVTPLRSKRNEWRSILLPERYCDPFCLFCCFNIFPMIRTQPKSCPELLVTIGSWFIDFSSLDGGSILIFFFDCKGKYWNFTRFTNANRKNIFALENEILFPLLL